MGLSVLDTSVIVAFRDTADTHHAAAVEALQQSARSHGLVAPAVSYAEVMVGALRAGSRRARVAERFFEEVARVEPVTKEIAAAAARLRARHRLRLPDALIIATGIELDAHEILTADSAWRRVDRRVRSLSTQ